MAEVEKIELHRSNFKHGTIGFDHFPDILEGRKRHSSVFRQPLERLPHLKNRSRLLATMGLITLSDLLNAPSDQFQGLPSPQRRRFQENLADFLTHYLILGPEDHLLRRVFGTQVRPISPELERQRNDTVATAVDTLPVFEKELLRVHFGLEDGLPKSLESAGRQLGVISTRNSRLELYRLRRIEQETFRGLRRNLMLWGIFPESSKYLV